MAYHSLHTFGEDRFVERKSEFIGDAMPVSSEEEALEFVATIKKRHQKAKHYCYAYIIGSAGIIQRFNDDGEPSGTAGIPMLEVLKKRELRDVCVVATRYFGGVLLGAGGLIRAYTKSAIIATEKAVIVEKKSGILLQVEFPYSYLGSVEYYLKKQEVREAKRDYGEKIDSFLWILEQDEPKIVASLQDIFGNEGVFKIVDREKLSVKDGKILFASSSEK